MTAPLPPTTASDAELAAFLREAARYFDRLPINGEDNAHWANMYNAKNCRQAADRLDKRSAEVAAKDALIAGLRTRLGLYAIREEFDYPAEVPEFCGYWCEDCKDHIEADGSAHGEKCLCRGVPPMTQRAIRTRAALTPRMEASDG
ncbi:MAG: hypothetical protein Q7T60_17100 [Sphingopyxis sp.]|nr:hypothetical protein [Sphingopyxis sp.]